MHRSTTITYRMAEAFFRNRLLFLVSFLIVSAVTMGTLYLRSKTFEASALTQVVTENVAAALGEQDNTGWVSPAQKNVNQLDVLLNGDLLKSALARPEVRLQRPINTEPTADDPRMALLRKKLTTSVQNGSDTLFSIGLTWDSPAEAEQIVQAVQHEYIDEIGQERFAQSASTLAFLDRQIKNYASRLSKAEQALTAYKRDNPGGSSDAQSADTSELQTLQSQLTDMRIASQNAVSKRADLEKRLAQITPQTVAEQTAAPSPLDTQINEMKARRDAMLINRLPTHPQVIALTDKIAAMERQRNAKRGAGAGEAMSVTRTRLENNPEYQSLSEQLDQARIDQHTQTQTMQNLTQQIAQYQERVKNIPAAQRALTDRTRDYKVVQAQYDTLLQRREQVKMEGNLAQINASSSLTPIGYVHAEPTTGRTKMLAMFAGSLVLGLIVGLVLVILCEWADHSLRYASDAERLLGVPVLAVVPEATSLRVLPAGDDARRNGTNRALRAPKKKESLAALEAPAMAPAMSASAAEGAQ